MLFNIYMARAAGMLLTQNAVLPVQVPDYLDMFGKQIHLGFDFGRTGPFVDIFVRAKSLSCPLQFCGKQLTFDHALMDNIEGRYVVKAQNLQGCFQFTLSESTNFG